MSKDIVGLYISPLLKGRTPGCAPPATLSSMPRQRPILSRFPGGPIPRHTYYERSALPSRDEESSETSATDEAVTEEADLCEADDEADVDMTQDDEPEVDEAGSDQAEVDEPERNEAEGAEQGDHEAQRPESDPVDVSQTHRRQGLQSPALPLDHFRATWSPNELMDSKLYAGDAEAYDGVVIYGLTFHKDQLLLLKPSARTDWRRYGVGNRGWTVPTVHVHAGSDLADKSMERLVLDEAKRHLVWTHIFVAPTFKLDVLRCWRTDDLEVRVIGSTPVVAGSALDGTPMVTGMAFVPTVKRYACVVVGLKAIKDWITTNGMLSPSSRVWFDEDEVKAMKDGDIGPAPLRAVILKVFRQERR